jgi:thioredoxin-related protein
MKTSLLSSLLAAFLCIAALPAFADAGWTTNFQKAMDQASTENKAVLLDFTGSDWCPWCIKMDKETLDQPAFKDYAKANLVCVLLDFPNQKPQPGSVKAQNAKLQKQYKVDAFPTFILLSKDGKVLWSFPGYMEGGPGPFLAAINKVYHPNPTAAAATGDDFDAAFKKPAQ